MSEVTEWNPSHLFQALTPDPSPYAIILLNAPISDAQTSTFLDLWSRAKLRLCADGGANRLLEAFPPSENAISGYTYTYDEVNKGKENHVYIPPPHEIRGDLDSIRPRTREFFEKRGVSVIERRSQYATDLQKCAKAVEIFEAESSPSASHTELELVIYGGLSGRFDQTVHTLHVLWTLGAPLPHPSAESAWEKDRDEDARLKRRKKTWVVGEQCLVWILPPGRHRIQARTPPLGPTCGILPLASSEGAKVTTRGLRWDIDASMPTSLPDFVSTSNQIPFDDSGRATIDLETDKTIYWSIELQES
ncbi:hypothetical protein OC846_005048 [Tilletia horrida]|uniref:Thiamin pyrophosphokinase thiamin-binding domain-containing protein n=1 Tax=Tilletia horrida TaxID=155126 RepID=A0AAN6GLL6_9BASI|nr:hypothetical protein OC846_005048 [Tilletia horrida]KAK0562561.1 hypothetical protein OC861_005250 [Tilletia horrida]